MSERTPISSNFSKGVSSTSRPSTRIAVRRAVVVAIAEGRGYARGEIGIASLGINSATLILTELSDNQNYTKTIAKLNVLQPTEVVIAANDCLPTGQNRLFELINDRLPEVKIVPVQRKFFSHTFGLTKIQGLVNEEFASVPLTVSNKYYVLAAAAAALEFAEQGHAIFISPRTLKIEFQGPENMVSIDAETVKHLELLLNLSDPGLPHSLLGVLDGCKTPTGSRMLRMNMLQPPIDINLINQRLECVQELVSNQELLYGLQANLLHLPMDLDQVISTLIRIPKADNEKTVEQRANFILTLKHVLWRFAGFIRILKECTHPYFQYLLTQFEQPVFTELREKIDFLINEEAMYEKGVTNMTKQRTFAIKAGVNSVLDVSRKIYCELVGDINEYVLSLSRQHKFPLQVSEHPKRGFYIHFRVRDNESKKINLPREFIHVRHSIHTISFTTEKLLTIDKRIRDLLIEILHISDILISQLLENIREKIGSLFKISDAISNLDMLHTFAIYSTVFECIKPEFSPSVTSITNGKHPILESMSLENPPVANDTFLSADVNVNIITGPNMSGKTTYLKQVALLQILAQIGCFVPAKAATFRIADAIFSRLGNQDNMEGGASSFVVEMKETNHILNNVTKSSLVLFDELGRATSVEEATAISWVIVETLMQKPAFILFATHFISLEELEYRHLRVLNYTMETLEDTAGDGLHSRRIQGKLTYTHRFVRGITKVEHYGLKLAKASSLLPSIVEDAEKIAETIMALRTPTFERDAGNKPSTRAKFLVGSQLALASRALVGKIDSSQAEAYLQQMKTLLQELKGCEDESEQYGQNTSSGGVENEPSSPSDNTSDVADLST